METPSTEQNLRSIRLTPQQLQNFTELGRALKPNGITLNNQTLADIGAVIRSLTGSGCKGDETLNNTIQEALSRINAKKLEVNLVTIYRLPPGKVTQLAAVLNGEKIIYKLIPGGIEVYGPHKDRTVEIEGLLRSGRVYLQKEQDPIIREQIEIKKL